jgi:adenylate kinase
MQYYNDQGKFYAVNGIGIEEITARLSTVIDNL